LFFLLKIKNNFFDISLAAYLLKPGTSGENLEEMVLNETGEFFQHQTTKKGQGSLLADNAKNEKLSTAEKAIWVRKLGDSFSQKLKEISKEQEKNIPEKIKKRGLGTIRGLFEKMELPLVKILAKMEVNGIVVDKKKLEEVSVQAEKEIKRIVQKIFDLAGEEFNLNSPLQLAKVLYEKLGISTNQVKKGKTGYSTDADQLRKIRHLHPIISLIEKYRELFKFKTTYADVLPVLIDNDGRLRTSFNQTVTATGRLSSSNPNLQNIPKKGKLAGAIRAAFMAEEGKVLVSADYSQIDLRVAAHLSKDEKLIESFKKGKDIHRMTAAWVNNISEDEVTDSQRNEAKALNFGILYGMGTYGFMRDSGVSQERAEFFIDQYMKTFGGLKKYLDEIKNFAREKGYVETEIGRRRYIANINSSNYQLRSAAERMAINFPIQGLAADIMKLAMVEIEEKMKKNEIAKASLLLQVHDELIFEVEKKLAQDFSKRIAKLMEEIYLLEVPLKIDLRMGKNWNELE